MKVSARRQAAGLVSDSARKVELYVVFRHYKDLECQIDHLCFFFLRNYFLELQECRRRNAQQIHIQLHEIQST